MGHDFIKSDGRSTVEHVGIDQQIRLVENKCFLKTEHEKHFPHVSTCCTLWTRIMTYVYTDQWSALEWLCMLSPGCDVN